MTVTKSATIAGNEDGFVGVTDVIDYTILVTNTGNVTIKGVELIDTLTDGDGNVLNIDTSAWLVRDIAPGKTEIYTAFILSNNQLQTVAVLSIQFRLLVLIQTEIQ